MSFLRSLSFCSCRRPKRIGKTYVWSETLDGKLQITMGPHYPGVIAVVIIILLGTYMDIRIIEFIPKINQGQIFVFRSLVVFFFPTTIVFLFLTACTDPGIVRVTPIEDHDSDMNNVPYCEICEIFQVESKNISHCQDCDVCIEGLDHHCPWMGKCVGKKNMKWFILFNVLWLSYLAQLLILCFGYTV